MLVVLAGCRGEHEPAIDHDPPLEAAPAAGALVERHNERVADLRLVHAHGNVEIRWVEDDKNRQIQGDADFWYLAPARTAVRVSKFGEELAWFGSNDDRCWLFDLTTDPSVVYESDAETPLDAFGQLSIQPWTLLDLMGMGRLTAKDADERAKRGDDVWIVEARGAGGPLRVAFETGTGRPVRIEALDDDGVVLLTSRLEDYSRVPLPDRAIVACPATAEQIRVTEPGDRAEVELYLREWTGDLTEDDVRNRFEFDRLREYLRPERLIER